MTGDAREVVLEATGLQHAYGPTVALRDASLLVGAGEVVAVTGPSGCGKSTLLHACAGLLVPASGSVTVLGHRLGDLGDDERARLRRSGIGIVLQYGQLVPELPALDNVALPMLLDGQPREAARALALEWLERCEVADLAATRPAQLSGGQAQRVAVARALVTRPGLVLADEPTGSLDSVAGRQMLDLLVRQSREHGAGLVLVTHDNTVAARADREVRMLDGAVVSVAGLT